MRNIKRKVFALILSINSISGFTIGAMKRDSNAIWHVKQQAYAESKNIEIPRSFYEKLMRVCNTHDSSEDANFTSDLFKDIKNIETKVEILKGFEENSVLNNIDIEKVKNLDETTMYGSGREEFPGCFQKFPKELLTLLKCFEFFIYYERDKNNEITELGMVYHNKENEKVRRISIGKLKPLYKIDIGSEVHLMPLKMNGYKKTTEEQ